MPPKVQDSELPEMTERAIESLTTPQRQVGYDCLRLITAVQVSRGEAVWLESRLDAALMVVEPSPT